MNNGGDAAEQVVRLSLEGFEVAARLSGSAAKNIALLLVSVLKQEQKTKGKARLTNMIKSGKELKVFSIPQKDLKKFTEQAKRYGVLYCVLRDKNTKGENAPVDIIARAEDASKIQRIVERFELGKVDKASIVSEAEKAIADREAVEKEKPTKSKSEIIMEEAVRNPMQKEERANANPSVAKTDKSPPVSAEVEAYEPIIQKYAKEYGIPEYVELIKAVMMQESGGRGLDPMQAAEGSFNTRYPHEPNGIKDPEYSIQCGVQELKAALTSAEVESPIDMEHIKLALQGYNFGNGYISWAKTNYGGYSYANAVEFSTQQAQRLGWDSYGDTQYPAHVLRYYPYGRAFTAGGNQAIVEVALTQLGNQGGQPYWSWYGFNSRVEWCACFVSWCADQCGYIESGLVPKFAGCVDGANWFKSNGKWQDRTYEPKVGDIIFFDWEGDGTTDHVGIVEKCENGTVYTVEGNSGDACKQRQYAVGSSNIYGYGIPAY